MLFFFILSAFLYFSSLVEGLQIGALVTMRQHDVSSVFLEEELYGVYHRTKNNILTIEVVFDEKRLMDIKHNTKLLSFEITIPDYSVVIHKEFARIANRTKFSVKPGSDQIDIFFQDFRPWFEYEAFLELLLLEYPEITSKSILGQTIQGRNIPIITLKTDEELDSSKPGFYIQATVHSNEWLANSATAYILKKICERYGTDDNITNILDNINIFIVPTVNIDGYIYTWIGSSERNWRKNRRDNGDGSFGVDINRNYGPDDIWGTTGTSHNPSSNTYCGTAPFSEPESFAVSQFIANPTYNIKAAVDMHTTGPYILWPWGYTYDELPQTEYNQYYDLGANMEEAAAINGLNYTSIQTSDWYLCSGIMHDWVAAVSNYEIIGFTFEGRPIGSGSPPIVAAGEEQLVALLYLANTLLPIN